MRVVVALMLAQSVLAFDIQSLLGRSRESAASAPSPLSMLSLLGAMAGGGSSRADDDFGIFGPPPTTTTTTQSPDQRNQNKVMLLMKKLLEIFEKLSVSLDDNKTMGATLKEHEPEVVRLMKWAVLMSVKRAADRIVHGEWPSRLEDVQIDFELPAKDSNGYCGCMDVTSVEVPACVQSIDFPYTPVRRIPIEGEETKKSKNMTEIIGSISGVSRISPEDDYTAFEKSDKIRGRMSIMPPRMEFDDVPVRLPKIAKLQVLSLIRKLEAAMKREKTIYDLAYAMRKMPKSTNMLLDSLKSEAEGSGWTPTDEKEGSGMEFGGGQWESNVKMTGITKYITLEEEPVEDVQPISPLAMMGPIMRLLKA